MGNKQENRQLENVFMTRARMHRHKSKLIHTAVLRASLFLTNPSDSPASKKIKLGLAVEAAGVFNPTDFFASEIIAGTLIFSGLKEMKFNPLKYRAMQNNKKQYNIRKIFSNPVPAYISTVTTPRL